MERTAGISELLVYLKARGVEIKADGDKLKIKAPCGVVTQELLKTLAAHKQEILAALAMPSRLELDSVCQRAVADFPGVDPIRLRSSLEAAQHRRWRTELAARQLARRMSEGLITWTPEDG